MTQNNKYNNKDEITDECAKHIWRQLSEDKWVARAVSFKDLNASIKIHKNIIPTVRTVLQKLETAYTGPHVQQLFLTFNF